MVKATSKKLVDMFFEYLKRSMAIIAVITAISTGLWFFMENEIQTATRNLIGYNAILESIDHINTFQRSLSDRLESLEQRIINLEPELRITEYDQERSRIIGVCSIGENCSFVYFARRNEGFETCVVTDVQRVLIDGNRSLHIGLNRQGNSSPSRLFNQWTSLENNFNVPENASPGISQFFYQLTYEDCDPDIFISSENSNYFIRPDGGIVVYEESFPLTFNLRQ